MAGVQLITGGGNITIIGGRADASQLASSADSLGGTTGDSEAARRSLDCEGLCVLSLGK